MTRLAERGTFKTFIFQEIKVPEIPWVDWQGVAIRDIGMRPEDFWSLPFPTAIKVICKPPEDSKEITRKEILEGEREFYARFKR